MTTLRRLWVRAGPAGRLVIWLLAVERISLALVGVALMRLMTPDYTVGHWPELVITGGEPWSRFLSVWQRWDALWYQHIVENGYTAGTGSVAFYPLFPLLVKAVSIPLLGHVVWAELVVSSVAFAAAMWLLYKVTRLDAPPLTAALTLLLVAFFPTGFFLLAPYTESLFLALAIGTLYLARQGRLGAAAAVGLLAGLTRAQGSFLALPLLYEYFRRRRFGRDGIDAGVLGTTTPIIAFVAVAAFHRLIVGDPTAPFEVNKMEVWGYEFVLPGATILPALRRIADRDVVEALNLACLLGFTGLAIVAARRLPVSYTLFVAPQLVVMFTRDTAVSPLASVARYVLVLFPCFIVAAIWLRRRPWLAAAVLAVGLALQSFLFAYWVHYGFVG